MNWIKHIFAIDSHTMGESTRVVIRGIEPIKGFTMAEKLDFLKSHFDCLRKSLMLEPRGHMDMFGAIITEPVDSEADLGVIFMDGNGYLNMCGHGIIGVITVALEMGFIKQQGQINHVKVDTPAGMVTANAFYEDGEVRNVCVQNVPSFLYRQDVQLALPGVGNISVDVAFGGNFFALVDCHDLGIEIRPENVARISEVGMRILDSINKEIEVCHPTNPHIRSVDLVEIHGPSSLPNAHGRNVVVFGKGQIDRSPCGTGTCARMATLYGKNQLKIGEPFINESIIGTTFKGQLTGQTNIGGIQAVIPEISGQAFITGIQQFLINSSDPLKFGFSLG